MVVARSLRSGDLMCSLECRLPWLASAAGARKGFAIGVALIGLLQGDPASANPQIVEQLLAAREFNAAGVEAEKLVAAARRAGTNTPAHVDALLLLAKVKRAGGADQEVLSVLQTALAALERTPNRAGSKRADVLLELAIVAEQLGKPDLAQEYAVRELALRENQFNKNAPELINPLFRVGRLYVARNKYAEALPLLLRAVSLPEVSRVTADRAPILFQIGRAQSGLGRHDIAEQYFQRVLEGIDSNNASQTENEIIVRISLAAAQNARKNFAQALANLERALALIEKKRSSGTSNSTPVITSQLLAAYFSLVVSHEGLGRIDEALKYSQMGLALTEATPSLDELVLADRLQGTAALKRKTRDFATAAAQYKRAAEIYKRVLGEGDTTTQHTLQALSDVYIEMGRSSEVRELAPRIIDETSPTSLSNLAISLRGEGRYAEAEAVQRRALEIQRKKDPNDPSVARLLNNLAGIVAQSSERFTEAVSIFQESLELKLKQLGPDHQDVAFTLDNLAWMYSTQRNYAAAKEASQRSLVIFEKTLGTRHPEYLKNLLTLGRIAYEESELDKSESYVSTVRTTAEATSPVPSGPRPNGK